PRLLTRPARKKPGEVVGVANLPLPANADQVDAARRISLLQRYERRLDVHLLRQAFRQRRRIERLGRCEQHGFEQTQMLGTQLGHARLLGDRLAPGQTGHASYPSFVATGGVLPLASAWFLTARLRRLSGANAGC